MAGGRAVARRWVGAGVLGAMALLSAGALASFGLNRRLPEEAVTTARLEGGDKARLTEAMHLRRVLGDSVWPGWGQAEIPLIVYDGKYAFLVGSEEPGVGWVPAPGGERLGGPWEPVPDDDFANGRYHRSTLPMGVTPQAFTVRIGEEWAASLGTKAWMEFELIRTVKEQVPPILGEILPYGAILRVVLKGSDGFVAALLHETFHAYQGIVATDRLVAAERTIGAAERDYPWEDRAFRSAWQAELDLLADALRAVSEAGIRDRVRRFLALRDRRRAGLRPHLIEYEREREWTEGLAKYTELMIWRAAAAAPGYRSVAALANESDFHDYRGAGRKWTQEIDQMSRMAGVHGDGRFYYTGMAQAALLDRLAPGWKPRFLTTGRHLEEVLREAAAGSSPST